MTAGWARGEPAPEGLRESTLGETAAMTLISGLIVRRGRLTAQEVNELIDGWAQATRANPAEDTAAFIVALCSLAAGPILRLAELEGIDPRHLIQAEVAAMEALAAMLRGGEAP